MWRVKRIPSAVLLGFSLVAVSACAANTDTVQRDQVTACHSPEVEGLSFKSINIPDAEAVYFAGDSSGLLVAICEDSLPRRAPVLDFAGMEVHPVGGWAETFEGSTSMLQFFIYSPVAGEGVLDWNGYRHAVEFGSLDMKQCPDLKTSENFRLLTCGWLMRGVWHPVVETDPFADFLDLVAHLDGNRVGAYVFGLVRSGDQVQVELAAPRLPPGGVLSIEIDTVQMNNKPVPWSSDERLTIES